MTKKRKRDVRRQVNIGGSITQKEGFVAARNRVPQWVRKDCLNSKYYERFDEFKTSLNQFLEKVSSGEIKEEMDTLLALNFQLFDNE